MLSTLILAKAIAALSAVTVSGSAAAAATGNLPTSLQDKVANVVEHVGVDLPGGHDIDADDGGEPTDSEGKGAEISEIARTTENTGVDKGAEISDAASGGKSRAGEHGRPESNPAGVDTPGGGAGTADTARDGADDPAGEAGGGRPEAGGPATADDRSGGRR